MPKTSVDEDGDLGISPDEIRISEYLGASSPSGDF